MATTNTTVTVNSTDNLTQLAAHIDDVNKSIEGVAQSSQDAAQGARRMGDTISREAKQAERSLDKLEDSASDASGAIIGIAGAAAGLAAGLVTIEALKKGFEVLGSVLATTAESNTALASTVDNAKAGINGLVVSLGEAIFASDSGTDAFNVFNQVVQDATAYINQNKDQIEAFVRTFVSNFLSALSTGVDVLGRVAIGINSLRAIVPLLQLGVVNLADGFLQFGLAIQQGFLGILSDVIDGLAGFLTSATELANAIPGVNIEIGGITSGMTDFADGLDESTARLQAQRDALSASADTMRNEYGNQIAAIDRQNQSIAASADYVSERLANFAIQMQAGGTSTIEFARAQEQASTATSATNESVEEQEESLNLLILVQQAFVEQWQAEQDKWAQGIEENSARVLAGKQAELDGLMKLQESEIAQQIATKDKLIAIEEERQAASDERRAQLTSSLQGTANALASIEGKTAKERKEAAKKAIGGVLTAEGGGLVAQGIGNLIALNPIGALQIAGGASMIAAGKKLGAGSAGGGGGAASAPASVPAQNIQAGSSTTINPVVNFGFVGDRRAAYRDVEEANRRGAERRV